MDATSLPTGLVVFLAFVGVGLLIALARFIINHHKHHLETMRAPAHNLSSTAQQVIEEPEASEEEATDEEEVDEYDGDEYVFDIQSSDDSDLELAEGEQAILMFFFNNCNEVCDKQWPIVKELSDKWQDKVRFVSVDATDPGTAPIAAFHEIHNVPAFALRKRGEVAYSTTVGSLNKDQLNSFVEKSLAPATSESCPIV